MGDRDVLRATTGIAALGLGVLSSSSCSVTDPTLLTGDAGADSSAVGDLDATMGMPGTGDGSATIDDGGGEDGTADAGLDASASEADAGDGAACDACSADKTPVTCDDSGANACGGCGTLSAAPGAACGRCGTYVCAASKASVTCNDPGTTNSCPTWCSSEPAPSGIAAADYQCLDFDNGLPSSNTWPSSAGGNGAVSRSTAKSSSAPASLLASVTSVSDSALLLWNDNGSASPVTATTISAAINPVFAGGPQWVGGGVNLMCAQTEGDVVCLTWTNGAMTNFQASYTGFYVWGSGVGGSTQCPVTNLPLNSWSNVQFIANHASGTIDLLVGGVNETTCSLPFSSDKNVNVQIGLAGSLGTSISGFSTYYDNVQVEVAR